MVPELLNEVHWLIENTKHVFGLCGSNARKIKRVHANLLGGRALRYELYGLVSKELDKDFDLVKLLNRGYLPNHYLAAKTEIKRLQSSYVGDYLKEEITAEALVRNLRNFSDFLSKAALSDTELINYNSFARDVGVSANTVKEYFSILNDTLLGYYVPSYQMRPKRRTSSADKFYFGNVGVVNYLAQRGELKPGSELFGKAFENWVSHELRAYNNYRDKFYNIYYWRLSTGIEVDFLIGGSNKILLACEAKASAKINSEHMKGLRELSKEYEIVDKKIIVSLEQISRITDDGIEILNVQDFVSQLWNGMLF
jgi:predicted AAA+ superfamily ATPase